MTIKDKVTDKLVVILGPTAVGKTALSINLAAQIDGEIISGDSMQFYKYMDIGTAKIKHEEMTAPNGKFIPHHLIDIILPNEPYSVASFQTHGEEIITDILNRGKLPLLVGGTGLYINALTDGYTLQQNVTCDIEFREAMKQEYSTKGGEYMLAKLCEFDPIAASKINSNDQKRIIRAMEVYHLTGVPISLQAKKKQPLRQTVFLGLTMDRAKLYDRINQRVLTMIEQGFIQEVEKLLDMGFDREQKPMQGLGYKQICSYLSGEISLDEAIELIQRDTRRFAKRQLTWWRKDERVIWFDLTDFEPERDMASMVNQMDQEILLHT